jgi:hypothetical protein
VAAENEFLRSILKEAGSYAQSSIRRFAELLRPSVNPIVISPGIRLPSGTGHMKPPGTPSVANRRLFIDIQESLDEGQRETEFTRTVLGARVLGPCRVQQWWWRQF